MMTYSMKLHKKPGFTLLETLISLVILTLVLGATLVATRTIAGQAQESAGQTQMNILAEEGVNAVRLMRDTLRSSGSSNSFAEAIGLNAVPAGVTGTFIANTKNIVGHPGTHTYSDVNFRSGPIVLKWCRQDSPATCLNDDGSNMVSPVGVDDSAHTSAACGSISDTSTQFCYVNNVMNALGGDLVAVRRAPYTSYNGGCTNGSGFLVDPPDVYYQWGNRQVVDASNNITAQPSRTCIFTSQLKEWDFYLREISVKRATGLYSDASAANQAVLDSNSYVVTVKITNYYTPSISVTKTTILTDYSPNNLIY